MTRKPKLTDLDLVLLSSAAARSDGMLLPPPESVRARGKTLERALAKLLRLGLVEECEPDAPDQIWREDDERVIGLRIAARGREALRLDEAGESGVAPQDARDAEATEAVEPPADGETEVPPENEPPSSLLQPEMGVKPGTKLARLVHCLSRPRGTSTADLSRLLGWQPHTVRAALTGLRKKGFRVITEKNNDGGTVYRAVASARADIDAA